MCIINSIVFFIAFSKYPETYIVILSFKHYINTLVATKTDYRVPIITINSVIVFISKYHVRVYIYERIQRIKELNNVNICLISNNIELTHDLNKNTPWDVNADFCEPQIATGLYHIDWSCVLTNPRAPVEFRCVFIKSSQWDSFWWPLPLYEIMAVFSIGFRTWRSLWVSYNVK